MTTARLREYFDATAASPMPGRDSLDAARCRRENHGSACKGGAAMSSDDSWGAELEENPLLSKLTRAGVSDSRTFWGYVGPSRAEGWVTLYPSLQNLGESIEIARADILHVEDVPETVLLFGAKVVWVRRDAKVNRGHATPAQAVGRQRPSAAATGHPKDDVVEVREGRLRMQMRARSDDPDCYSPCATCRDCSSVCISICQYVPPEE
jgi:hypothetical protein